MNQYSDIISRRYRFPDNGEMQYFKRPTVNISDEVEEKVYFLAMTSKEKHYVKNKDRLIKVTPGPDSKLKSVSYVKTEHVLSEDWKNVVESGYLSEEQMLEIEEQMEEFGYIADCASSYCNCEEYNKKGLKSQSKRFNDF